MAQWGAGFQYPLQTGYNNPQFQQQNPQFQQQSPQFQQQPQQQQFQQQNPQFQPQQQQGAGGFGAPSAGLLPQQTGFPVQRPQFLQQPPQIGFQQPQQTGFSPQGLLQQQPTGFVGGTFQQTRAPPPPVPALPPQFQRPNNGSTFLIPQSQQQQQPQHQQPPTSGFLSPSPALGGIGMGIPSQPTGFAPRAAPLVPQMTGYVDPRLQMMSETFMPSTPYGGAAPQLAPPQQNLIQSIQQHNEAARGTARQTMPWALSKAEKKNYNDIFRNWDAQNTGFISGHTALEVFGASGLPKDDLARIWTLADIDDRGKLNVQEFHVAMGLIYRRLNGMPIPDQLPPELIPPSARDLDESVEVMKSLLQYENRSRSPSSVDSPVSRLKNRSFNTTGSSIESGRDATIYKHSDSEPPGGFYKPRSRHVDRDAVRRTDDASPTSDLSDMKRQLASTAQMLDRASEATAEDEELDREMDDLKYRVKRVQDDIDYVSRGPKTASKDEERRKLERELLSLMHERLPEVERKIKARDERKEREKRQWARDRDRANEKFGRYDDKDRDRDYATRRGDDRDRPYSRNYDRDERGYDRDEREGRESRSRDREGRESRNRDRDYDPREREWDRRDTYDRPRSTAPRSPPPPASPSSTLSANPTGALPPPKSAPSPAPLKNMTREERQAYTRAQAQQRIEARKVALGVISPSSAPVAIDTAVEDRLQQDKKEAEEKAKQAEKEREERERVRRERVESERAAREPVVPKPTPTRTVTAPPPVPTGRTAPPAPKPRAPAPPPPRKAAPRQVPVTPKVAPVVPKADLEGGRRRAEEERIRAEEERTRVEQERIRAEEEKIRAEEEKFRAREEALRKQREERSARLRQLEKEEEEQERLEEERYRARVEALKARNATPKVVEPPVKVAQEPVKIAEPVKATSLAVIPPSAPQASASPATPIEKSTNPFSRLLSQGASAPATPAVTTPAAATNGSTNPWARPQTAPLPSKSPVSAAVKTSYQTVPAANEDDWDIIKEKNESDDDSSDDELAQSRTARANIAQQLFGSILPRPQSSGPVSSPSSPAPVTGAGAGVSPPPPPPAPQAPAMFAPPPATAVTQAAGPSDVSALMQSIQGGMRLRPTKTVDKSAPPVSGRVIGDTEPPSHINVNVAPTPAQEQPNYPERVSSLPQPTPMDGPPKLSNRQSVGWFTTRAADAGVSPVDQLPVTVEGEEDDNDDDIYATPPPIPSIQVDEHVSEPVSDLMADIDKSIQHRARSLYAYEGDGPEDLSFAENLVLTVHPSKSGGDWWYGTTLKDGKSGLFPKTYIEVFQTTKATALYTYEGNNADECSFDEGDELPIVDKSDAEWWKTEQNGVVLIVPAAYLEDVEG